MAAKKKFELESSIVQVSRGVEQEVPAADAYPSPQEAAEAEQLKVKMIYLNFSVSEDFRKEFKIWCAKKGLKQNEALVKMFDRIKNLDLM